MKTFYVGIKAVIIKDDKVLILHTNVNKERPDMWEVPGGRIDDEESIEQALLRELKEELPNIKAIVMEEIVDAYRLNKDIDGDKSLVLVFYKVSADFDGNPKISDEHVEYEWATEKEALKKVAPSFRRAIRNAFATNTNTL